MIPFAGFCTRNRCKRCCLLQITGMVGRPIQLTLELSQLLYSFRFRHRNIWNIVIKFTLLPTDPHHQPLYQNFSEFLSPLDGSSKTPNISGMSMIHGITQHAYKQSPSKKKMGRKSKIVSKIKIINIFSESTEKNECQLKWGNFYAIYRLLIRVLISL